MTKTLLYIDQNPKTQLAFKEVFGGKGYEVLTTSSADEVVTILSQQKVGLLLCNLEAYMAEGLDLLKYAKEHHPRTLRFVMSGLADKSKILDIIGNNLARQYIITPWNEEALFNAVEGAFNLMDKLKDESLVQIYNNISELPSPPWVYFRIMQMLDEDAAMADIANMIEQDQAMTSKILRVANSAFFGPKTGFIQDAIVYIGLINIKNIVLTSELYDLTDSESKQLDDLLEHAETTNKLMNCIYRKFIGRPLDNCYAAAGLLHDIGKLLMVHNFKPEQKKIYQQALQGKVKDVNALEIEHLQVDHQALGGYLLGWWQMPLAVIEAALYHHDPMHPDVTNKELVAVVHIADYYASKRFGNRGFHEVLVPEAFGILNMTQEEFERDLDACPLS